jgi:integration host factor subunit beta
MIADNVDLPTALVAEIVQKTFDGIIETLVKEGRFELRNFGVFQVKERKPRKARNPRTGEIVDVPKKMVVTFKPGLNMEELVGKTKQCPDNAPPPDNASEEPHADSL